MSSKIPSESQKEQKCSRDGWNSLPEKISLVAFFDDTYDAKIMIQNFNFYDI